MTPFPMGPHETAAELRAKVVELARLWLQTPYVSMGRVRGAGVDCGMLPLEVYRDAGIVCSEPKIGFYPADWALHRDDERYLQYVREIAASNGCREVLPPPRRTPLAGDFLLFQAGRSYSHGALAIEWPLCIHAHRLRGVVYVDAMRHSKLSRKIAEGKVLCFTFGADAEAGDVR